MSREDWLAAALDYIARHGWARLRIRGLCANLGVTTGSFYAHFDGRDDFVQSAIEFWKVQSTTDIFEEIRNANGDPRSQLVTLATRIVDRELNGLDSVIRVWVAAEPALAPVVQAADEERFAFVRKLFAQSGYRGTELDMRARTFITYYAMERSITTGGDKKSRLNEVSRRVAMLLAPAAG